MPKKHSKGPSPASLEPRARTAEHRNEAHTLSEAMVAACTLVEAIVGAEIAAPVLDRLATRMRADGEEMSGGTWPWGIETIRAAQIETWTAGRLFVELRDYAFGAVGEPTDGKAPFRAAIDKKIA